MNTTSQPMTPQQKRRQTLAKKAALKALMRELKPEQVVDAISDVINEGQWNERALDMLAETLG